MNSMHPGSADWRDRLWRGGRLVAALLGACAMPLASAQEPAPAAPVPPEPAAQAAPAAPPAPAPTPAPVPPPAPPPPRRLVSDTGARYGDLSLPLKLSPALMRVLLTDVTLELPQPAGGRQRWQ